MPLDPGIAALLEMIDDAGYPPLHESTPEVARTAYRVLTYDAVTPETLVQVGKVEELTAKARTRYGELGVPERFEYVSYAGGHAFPEEMRERSYAWLDRWLSA